MIVRIFKILDELFPDNETFIALDRIQFEERTQRRLALDREHSGEDAQACFKRVRHRMTFGDRDWIPPYYNREKKYRKWCQKRRRKGLPIPEQVTRIGR